MTPPVFSHGALRLYLLSLLADAPRHGYEVIQSLGDRFGGTYSPSAGTVYPRLARLEEEGLVTKQTDGRRTIYEITDAGRAELDRRSDELRDIESQVTDSVRRLADGVRSSVDEAMRSLRAELASAAARESSAPAPAAEPSTDGDGDGPVPERAAAREQVAQADLVIDGFRRRIRADLRGAAARGRLDAATVARLQSGLDALRTEIESSVGGRTDL